MDNMKKYAFYMPKSLIDDDDKQFDSFIYCKFAHMCVYVVIFCNQTAGVHLLHNFN